MKKQEQQNRFCKFCGSKMIEDLVFAEKYQIRGVPPIIPITNKRFNEKTGKRNYIKQYTCPNRKWWNNSKHSQYAMGDLINL
jgi:hypothetical protein